MTATVFSERVTTLFYEGVSVDSIARRLWMTRRRSITIIVIPALATLALGFVLPKWYRSGATFTVDAGQSLPSVSSSFAGLASQFGLGTGATSTSPQFY